MEPGNEKKIDGVGWENELYPLTLHPTLSTED